MVLDIYRRIIYSIIILSGTDYINAAQSRSVTNTDTLVRNETVEFHPVYPASILKCSRYPLSHLFYPAYGKNYVDPMTMYDGGIHFKEGGILELPFGKVFSNEGAVLTAEDHLLDFTVEYFYAGARATYRATQHPIRSRRLGNPRSSSETIAVLAARNYNNYYGWLFGILPRYHLLSQANVDYDVLYLPPVSKHFQKETLRLLNIPSTAKCLHAQGGTYIQANTLLVPTMSENRKQYPQWVIDFLRESFLPLTTKTNQRKRIYIARQSRRIVNEKELLALLTQLGFQKVYLERLPFLEQVQLFSEAEFVIGAHGAGFANIVFAPHDAIIIEIFNQGWLSPTFWGISQHFNRVHHCVLSDMKKLSSGQKGSFMGYAPMEEIRTLLSQNPSIAKELEMIQYNEISRED